MGLFDIFKSNPEELPCERRPLVPDRLLKHWNDECESVYGTIYHQDALEPIHDKSVRVTISPDAGEFGYDVMLMNGTVVGSVHDSQVGRVLMDDGRTTVAEVSRPIYRTTDHVELYLPLTERAMADDAAERERRAEMDALRLWVNVDASKWQGPTLDSGQMEYDGADFVTTERKGAKPLIAIVADGVTLTEFNGRMKAYGDIAERSAHHIRLLIVKRMDGQYGPFYKLGLYF